MTSSAPPSSGKARAVLPRELGEFLIELSIGVHRFAMYPVGHPSLEPVTANVRKGLALLMKTRPNLSIGVAQKQLVIQGVATDPKHPVLSDLARRLHAHQLGALVFEKDVTLLELDGFLKTLAQEPEREGRPIGLLPPNELPSWDHIRILPVGYDRMRMRDGKGAAGEGDRSLRLWVQLAQVALGEQSGVDGAQMDGGALARLIEGQGREGAHDKVVVDYLMQLAEELRSDAGSQAAEIREKVSALVHELDPETLRRMLEMVGSAAKRRRFVMDSSQSLAADAVIRIVQAAAAASQQTISNSLTRLLSKMAIHSERGNQKVRPRADEALRESVEGLLADWELVDPNPQEYTLLLDTMANASPVFTFDGRPEQEVPGAMRVLQTALEIDAYGPTLQKAVSELLDDGQIGFLLEMLDSAPGGSTVAERLRNQLTTPYQLKKLLEGDDVSEQGLNALVDRIGPPAIETLLEFLTESESRATRRKVFDCLVRMGPSAGEKALEWLKDPRWYVQRNMLALLHQMETLPKDFTPAPYLASADARVRREGLPLALRFPHLRDKALAMAVADPDERLVRMALLELKAGLPETVLPILMARVIDADRSPDLKALGIRSLQGSRSRLALEALLRICSGGRTLLGRMKLPPASPPLLAALAVLRREWSANAEAATVLKRAEASKDPEIRAAAAPGAMSSSAFPDAGSSPDSGESA